MILTPKDEKAFLSSFQPTELTAIDDFVKANDMAASAIEQFAVIQTTKVVPAPTSLSDLMHWGEQLAAGMSGISMCLHEFVYGPGSLRILNFWMLQMMAIDRKTSPIMQGRVLPAAIEFARLQKMPLHLIWFVARWDEWQGHHDWRDRIGGFDDNRSAPEEAHLAEAKWNQFVDLMAHVAANRHAWAQAAIQEVADDIALMQANDFELEPIELDFWPSGDGGAIDFSNYYYFPAEEIKDLFDHLDPTERRGFDESIVPLASSLDKFKELLETHPISVMLKEKMGEEEFGQMTESIAAPEQVDEIDVEEARMFQLAVLNRSFGVYMLCRSFNNPHPADNILWYICRMEVFLKRGHPDLAAKVWEEAKPIFDFHLPPIAGLWLMNLRRKLIHLQNDPATFGADIAWLHAMEKKFVAALQAGNYTSES